MAYHAIFSALRHMPYRLILNLFFGRTCLALKKRRQVPHGAGEKRTLKHKPTTAEIRMTIRIDPVLYTMYDALLPA